VIRRADKPDFERFVTAVRGGFPIGCCGRGAGVLLQATIDNGRCLISL
jgi:hypothetical protein